MRVPAKFLFSAFALSIAAPLAAQGAGGDAKCLLVSNLYARAGKEAKAKQVAQSARLFYGARVSALPSAQVQDLLTAQVKQITPDNAAATMTACAQAMEKSLRSLQAVTSRIQPAKE